MFIKYIRLTILTSFQFILLALLIVGITSQLIANPEKINKVQFFFKAYQPLFLEVHLLFFAALYLIWPHLITCYSAHKKQNINISQIKAATSVRYYLAAIIAFFEFISWWR